MYKIILTIAALLLITTTAIAGDKPVTKLGPCLKACVQPFNPAINDVGADANISVEDFNAADCVAACKSPEYDASCAFVEDGCCAEPDSADPDCGILVENWHIELSDGSGSGDFVLTKDSNGVVTSSGIITLPTPYGFDITLSYQGGSVIGSDGEYDSTYSGIASSPYGNSSFQTTTSGVVSQGLGTGQSETEFFSPGWPVKTTATFLMTRISGSGITPETGSVDINAGSDEQYLYCLSDCGRTGFVITNLSAVPSKYDRIQTCIYTFEFGINTVTTCTGELFVESTGITYNFSSTSNWDTCTIAVEVDGIGSCQTNNF